MRVSKVFRVNNYRFQVMTDFFNIFNTSAISSINTTFGSSLHRVTGVESPRQFRLGGQFEF
jgi:hypothetical protein